MDKVINCLFAAITLLLSARGEVFKGKKDLRAEQSCLMPRRGVEENPALKLSLVTVHSPATLRGFTWCGFKHGVKVIQLIRVQLLAFDFRHSLPPQRWHSFTSSLFFFSFGGSNLSCRRAQRAGARPPPELCRVASAARLSATPSFKASSLFVSNFVLVSCCLM